MKAGSPPVDTYGRRQRHAAIVRAVSAGFILKHPELGDFSPWKVRKYLDGDMILAGGERIKMDDVRIGAKIDFPYGEFWKDEDFLEWWERYKDVKKRHARGTR